MKHGIYKKDNTTNNIGGALIWGVFAGVVAYLAFWSVELSILIGFSSFIIIGCLFRMVEILEEIRDNLVELNKKQNQ